MRSDSILEINFFHWLVISAMFHEMIKVSNQETTAIRSGSLFHEFKSYYTEHYTYS